MNQTQRGPDGMIATEDKAIAGASQNCCHPASIGLNASSQRVTKTAAVNGAPEIRVQLEIGAAPFTAHRAKQIFKVFLDLRMRAVENVPGPMPPTAKCHK